MGTLIFRALGAGMLVAFIAGTGGCGASYSDSCKPGKMVSCKCESGAKGSKACDDKEAACECGGAEATDVGTDGFGDPYSDTTSDPPNTTDPPLESDGGAPVEDDAGTTPTGDGGTLVEIPKDPESAAPNCAKLENRAKRVATSNVLDDAPQALGGTVAPGVYVQTWLVHYRGANGIREAKMARSAETLEIHEDGTGRVTVKDNDKPETHSGILFMTNGTNVAVEPVCPQGQVMSYGYTATSRQLIIYNPPWARYFELQEKAPPSEGEETPAPETEEGQ
ncbi:MAG: hypothetical protein U0174_21780 [Polyangiaceae bacterium]